MEVATAAPADTEAGTSAQRRSEVMGPVWTHDEIAAAAGATTEAAKRLMAPPADRWPDGVRVDAAKWVYWLPAGFGQGLKTTSGGRDQKCYIGPQGNLFYHKKDVERALGFELAATPPGGGRPGDLDRAPPWDDRLPKDWRLAFRRLPNGKDHKIFIMPDEDRFFWAIKDVQLYLAGFGGREGTPLYGGQHASRPSAAKKRPSSPAVLPPERETPPAKRRGTVQSDIELMPGQVPALETPGPSRAEESEAGPSTPGRRSLSQAVAGHPLPRDGSAPPGAGMDQGAVTGPSLALPAPERQRAEEEGQAATHGAAAAAGGATGELASAAARGAWPPPPRGAAAPETATAPVPADQLPPATLEEFFQFLQCQLRMEAREIISEEVSLVDPGASAMWKAYLDFVTPNLGAMERWVPYHTALGVHEFFLISSVHHRDEPSWDERRRFFAIFIFRAHCKKDFFTRAQLPHLLGEDFWRDPVAAFAPGGPLEESMRHYRRTTKQPLLTLAMRMIPDRLLEDDDDNLVRSIVLRTQALLDVADQSWPVIKNPRLSAAEKFDRISDLVQGARGLGETWAKMMTVCIDLAYPKIGLLASQCNVGIGAQGPLRCLLGDRGPSEPKEALKELVHRLNSSRSESSDRFWALLPQVEGLVRGRYQSMPLILDQVRTPRGGLTAVTLQVQLCEYRQFRNFLAKSQLGLPFDSSMKMAEREKRMRVDDYLEYDAAAQVIRFTFEAKAGESIEIETPLAMTHGRQRLAERVIKMCFEKIRDGASKEEALAFRDELCRQCYDAPDVPDDSEAWGYCKTTLKHSSPLVSFTMQQENTKICFQTTVKAAGGVMEAERIARLCYARLESGASRQSVLEYRAELYRTAGAGGAKNLPGLKPLPGIKQWLGGPGR